MVLYVLSTHFSQWQACFGHNIPSYRWVCRDPSGAIVFALACFRFLSSGHPTEPRFQHFLLLQLLSLEIPTPMLKVDPGIFVLFSDHHATEWLLNGSFLIILTRVISNFVLFIRDIDPPSMCPVLFPRHWKPCLWHNIPWYRVCEYTGCFHARLLAFVTYPWASSSKLRYIHVKREHCQPKA